MEIKDNNNIVPLAATKRMKRPRILDDFNVTVMFL